MHHTHTHKSWIFRFSAGEFLKKHPIRHEIMIKSTTPLIFHFLSVFIRAASACCVNDPFISVSLVCMCACTTLGGDSASVRQSLPGVCDVQTDYRDALKLWLLMSLVTERTDPCLLLPYTEPSGTLTKGPTLNLSLSSALYVPFVL